MRVSNTLYLLVFFSTLLKAQVHIPVLPNLAGNDLLDEIINEYKPLSVLDYAAARDLMYGSIYNENDSVSCLYTGHTLYLPQNVDPSIHLYMNGAADGINCEHTYPRSKGADEDSGNAFSDMHHLFPARAAVNTSRGNSPFGEINDSQTASWFYLDQTRNSIPTTNIDSYSERINGRFEPREEYKGNVARAVFYFFTMYKEEALAADPDFFESQREILYAWHRQDPVDSIEFERTYMIAAYQNDLPNPFVLDSSLIFRSFSEAITATNEIDQAKPLIYPNPVSDFINVTLAGKNNLQVVDILGKVFIKTQFINTIELDFSIMNPGTYFVLVNEKKFRVMKI